MAYPKKKTGKSLEKLIEHLEKVLTDNTNTTIQAPVRLPDRITGRKREHDVLITSKIGHHNLVIAIECRDRSRPIGVNQVESFRTKCQDTGVNQGILVSPTGFWKTAIKKAEHYGIKCLTIEDALSFNWLLTRGITLFHRNIKHIAWTLAPSEQLNKPVKEYEMVDINGNEISLDILNNRVYNYIKQQNMRSEELGFNKTKLIFPGESIFLKDKKTGKRIELKNLIADFTYEVTCELSPFTLIKYSNKGTEEEIAEAAYAPINVGNIAGKIMLVKKQGEGAKIAFINDQNKKEINHLVTQDSI